jgi:hypothetical protein
VRALYSRAEQRARSLIADARDSLIIEPWPPFISRPWRQRAWNRFTSAAMRARQSRARRSGAAPPACENVTVSHMDGDERVMLSGRPGSRAGQPASCWSHYRVADSGIDIVLAPGAACALDEDRLVDDLRALLEKLVEIGLAGSARALSVG